MVKRGCWCGFNPPKRNLNITISTTETFGDTGFNPPKRNLNYYSPIWINIHSKSFNPPKRNLNIDEEIKRLGVEKVSIHQRGI